MLAPRALFLLLNVYPVCHSVAAAVVPKQITVQPTASGIFEIGDDSSGGKCSDSQVATINTWLEETVKIHNAALAAYHGIGTDEIYQAMFETWLNIQFDDDEVDEFFSDWWNKVGTRLAAVATFLSGGGITGGKAGKPYLFCGDTFAQQQKWSNFARDGTGADMVKSSDDNGATAYYTVEEVYPKMKDYQVTELNANGETVMIQSVTPFWVSSLKGYVFDGSGEDSLCDKTTRVASTSRADTNAGTEAGSPEGFTYAAFNRHIYLCPLAFVANPGKHHGYATLADVVSYSTYPTLASKDPAQFSSLSCTLYHELFHLTDTAGEDNDRNFYESKIIIASGDRTVLDAPEPYVYLAMAAYIYQNPPATPDGETEKPAIYYTDRKRWKYA